MDNLAGFAGTLTEAVLWLKILSGLVTLVALPSLLWALSISRQIDAIVKYLEKHDDTWTMSKTHGESFAGLYRQFRKVERYLIDLTHESRRGRK